MHPFSILITFFEWVNIFQSRTHICLHLCVFTWGSRRLHVSLHPHQKPFKIPKTNWDFNTEFSMEGARGFCDLNIAAAASDLKKTVLKALSIGYQTIALNTEVTDTSTTEKKKKKKGILSCLFVFFSVNLEMMLKYRSPGGNFFFF